MARIVLALAVALCSSPVVPARLRADGPWSAPQRYELEAVLEPETATVRGRARISFTNSSTAPLEELRFHAYLNAFRDEQSVFMRESGGTLRGEQFAGAGSISVQSLRVAGEELVAKAEHELVAGDRTQLRVPLPTALPPGAQVVIETRFVAKLPKLFARTGHVDGFFSVAQWFPKLAKLEPDGHFESFPYHALGEFYADFADYTLSVRVPRAFEVVGSGERVEDKLLGEERLSRFQAERVHDLAFIAARGYRTDVESVEGVLVRYFAPPGYEAATREHARVVRAGLRQFGQAFGSYPYSTLTLVVPPRAGAGAAGMEYPTLIVVDATWLQLPRLPSLSGAFVTAHELAHQWFYGLLASNELRYPVLDEGLTQWAALDLMRTIYGPREGLGSALSFDRFELERRLALHAVPGTATDQPAYAYTPAEYSATVYARAALALESIRRAYGQPRFTQALSHYTRTQRFQHPVPADLEASFDAAYGHGFAAQTLRPLLFGGEQPGVHLTQAESERRAAGHVTRVRARRTGRVALPTWLVLWDRRGRELQRVRWPSDLPSLDAELTTSVPVASVALDPDRALLLDPDVGDQVAHFASSTAPRAFTQPGFAQIVGWAQLLAAWVGP